MALYADNLLQVEGLDPISKEILRFISILDHYGAWDWNLRIVGLIASLIFLNIRVFFKKKRGVDWYALSHAIISATGALMCIYLDLFAAEKLTRIPEPLRSCQCHGPLTSLHRILPAITMGYSLFDLIDGLTIGIDFALHGLCTLAVMAYYCETGTPHFVTPMLLMECSTPFLTVVRADFFDNIVSIVNQACFVLFFFAFRIVFVPYIWLKLMKVMYENHSTPTFQECFPPGFAIFAFCLGMFFHVLNTYWFIKIIKKARRKILGIEKVRHNNDLVEEAKKQQ